MAGTQLLKRIPSIKFSPRHLKPSGSELQQPTTLGSGQKSFLTSEVPAPPSNTAIGGKASLQPKRTPVSQYEIDAIMLGGCV